MSTTASYRVELDLFAGPIDLLLYLVRRSELATHSLSLSTLARQFRETIAGLELLDEELDLELAGRFVVALSTLLEMKGRAALPQEVSSEPEPEAVEESVDREDLVARLLLFKRVKDAAGVLATRAETQSQRYSRLVNERPASTSDPASDRIRGVEVWDLLSAFSRIAATQLERGVEAIRHEAVPVHIYVEEIATGIRENGPTSFRRLFAGRHDRQSVVGIFLAILELVRHHGFAAQQDQRGGDITIAAGSEANSAESWPRSQPIARADASSGRSETAR